MRPGIVGDLGDSFGDTRDGMQLSVRAMAAALGVSKSQVARDSADGMPMHEAAAARAWRQQHRDVSRTVEGRIDRPSAASAPAAPPPITSLPPALPPLPEEDEEPAPTDTDEYRRARTAREKLRLQREQMDFDQARGLLIDASEAARMAYTTFRALRDAVFNVPARVAPQCASETDAHRIEAVIDAELVAAFNRVNPERLLTETDADDDPD